jgi:hypothetical protein
MSGAPATHALAASITASLLVGVERGRFAGSTQRDNAGDAAGDTVAESLDGFDVDRTRLVERRISGIQTPCR